MRCAAIVLAGGAGLRADPERTGLPKQYRMLGGRPVIAHALDVFLAHPGVDEVQVVLRSGTEAAYGAAVAPHPRLRAPVAGGVERQDSVRHGLEALAAAPPELVLIHDAARPFASARLIDRLLEILQARDAAIPAVAVADTLKRVGEAGVIAETVDRQGLFAAQTPQGFRYAPILEAHRRAAGAGLAFTDDSAVAEWYGMEVACIDGEPSNRKLTTVDDFTVAPHRAPPQTRFGTGYDVHRFAPGDHVMLCGVAVPFGQALAGHSDADVGLHALTDALLATVAEGDIGSHFPPADPRWRGADSALFLEHARDRVAALGGTIVNVDVTLICEAPKIGPHREAMRRRVAGLLGVDPARVSVKATTTEGLGFAGRGEGIAAQAAAAVEFPRPAGAPR